MSLGTYPMIGLKDARGRRDEARKQLAAGIDPSAARKAAKAGAWAPSHSEEPPHAVVRVRVTTDKKPLARIPAAMYKGDEVGPEHARKGSRKARRGRHSK